MEVKIGAVAGAWSRLALRRHVAADDLLGALAGTEAGLAFHIAVARLAACHVHTFVTWS